MDLARPGTPAPVRALAGASRLAPRSALRLIVAPIVIALAGCASFGSRPVNQEVQLSALSGGNPVEAACEIGNDRGKWTVIAPISVGVTRSAGPLTVTCVDAEGRQGRHVATATRASATAIGGATAYDYPSRLTLELEAAPANGSATMTVASIPFAAIGDIARVPSVDESGREGYRRFLAGPSPRAFAVADNGYWIRVNGSRGADRLAIDRCQSAGTVCKLYAVNDMVVWDRARLPDLLAAQ